MKKKMIFAAIILGFLASSCARRTVSMNEYGYCGKTIVKLGERYKYVLHKCGQPADIYFYENDLGLRLGTRLTYPGKKLVIVKFQNEFLIDVKQTSVEDSPVYLYFDRWGICIKIQIGDNNG